MIARRQTIAAGVGCHAWLALFALLLAPAAYGQVSQPQDPSEPKESLEIAAARLLARHCLECHNGSDRKGGLDLSRRAAALQGGETGSAVTPGDAEASLLVARVAAAEMPPGGRPALTAREQQALREWIKSGARWESDPIDPFRYTTDRRAGYDWWSLRPLPRVQPPQVSRADWPVNPIDQFILHRLERAGLEPSARAEPRTLIRRLSFDLLGLPPSPEEIEEFLADRGGRAYENLVDRLLDSPHFGERWARHWLDIVRFGESQGFERNKLRPNAWKYRDFVVEAFNSDMPYDQFMRWQIAGDVLAPGDPLAVVASGFLVVGPYDLTAYTNGTAAMRAFAREEELEGLMATVGQTFLGLTINCARCHDHKFDPVTQREYYQLSAALGGTYHGDERESLSPDRARSVQERSAEIAFQLAEVYAALQGAGPVERERKSARASRLEAISALTCGGAAHTTVPSQPKAWRILARGDYRQPGETVTPGGIRAVAGVAADWGLAETAPEGQRRVVLANWLADPNNPLPPRVIVNRLWGHLMGEGLVRTPSDFGFQGGLPSHPELLDWLAGQLLRPDSGEPWRLKRLIRLIVTSATYQQASGPNAEAARVDAENRLLWRRGLRRLDAETYRDSVLVVSGELDRRLGGPGFRDFSVSSAGNNETYTVFDAVGGPFNRRTLYRTCVRTGTSPWLDVLDCPDPSVATPRRSVTSTPLQALSLLNDRFIEHHAARFARRLEQEVPGDAAAQVLRAWLLAFGRAATEMEVAFALEFIGRHGMPQFCVVLLNANEFAYVD
jgi:mono/diheme cytochrome c family protein